MVSFRSGVTAFVVLFSLFGPLHAVPLGEKLQQLSSPARDYLKRSTPAAPRFVVYNDAWVYPFPPPSSLTGFNVFLISFLLLSGPADQAESWAQLTASQRSNFITEYNNAGISLMVSAFGSTDIPTSLGANPVTVANTMGNWVVDYGLQGIDVDYEDFGAFDRSDGSAENWLITFTQQLRTILPVGQYSLSHAPVAPWFSPSLWSGGGYIAVDRSVGYLIDWYNVQFYNQGTTEYTTCYGLLTASSSRWPQSALYQISANGVDWNKLLIGKAGTPSDVASGYMDPSTLATCVSEAHAQGWDAGVMVWEYPDATSSWIETVRGSTWPVTNTSPPPPTTPTSGNCAGVAAWDPNTIYHHGDEATYNGGLWTAKWWTQNNVPGDSSGVWTYDGGC